MRLSDYFDENLPTDEELRAISREERLAKMRDYEACLRAFLADARENPEAQPEQVAQATEFLELLTSTRERSEQAQRDVEETQAALERAQERAHLHEASLSQALSALPPAELRALMQEAKKQYGAHSKDYQELIDILRQFAPERLALALDT